MQISYKASFCDTISARFQGEILSGTHIDTTRDVTVLHQVVGGKDGIVWLDDCLGNLGGWEDGEGSEHSVGVFLPDLC